MTAQRRSVLPHHEPRDARGAAVSALFSPVSNARYAAGARTKLLAKLGIESVWDLVTCYPRRYLDMSKVATAASAPIGETCTVVGQVYEISERQTRQRKSLVTATIVDETGAMQAVWFSQRWIMNKLKKGMTVALSGKVEFKYGYKQMNSPFSDVLLDPTDADSQAADLSERSLVIPIHRATSGLTQSWMRRLISAAVTDLDAAGDPLPADLRDSHRLMRRAAALRAIHFPHSMEERQAARTRLAYDEVLALQLYMLMHRNEELSGIEPHCHVTDGPALAALRAALPFSLTDEQEDAVAAILADMAAPQVMNRLLEGDVGTGKTIVAAHALAAAADSGSQAAMMAPTSVLAAQYRDKLGPLLDECGVTWALLTGATSASERAHIIEGVASGAISVLFGTHALLEDDVPFARLTLAVIDEQQRFGVEQRSALTNKGRGADLLSMTATPIPRSLALALYGDLTCTYLRKKPRPGATVTTTVIDKRRRDKAYEAVREALSRGEQAYIVCPLVGVPEKRSKAGEDAEDDAPFKIADDIARGVELADATAAENLAAALQRQTFSDYRVGLLTGRMRPAEKERVMADFSAGRIHVLVSTTVIEVGIDVPNATVMLIEDAELFGL